MDVFLEKIVTRRKTGVDYLIIGAVIVGIIAMFLFVIPVLAQYLQGVSLIAFMGVAYLGFRIISTRNIEYEYAVTNGDIDIDKIISQRKRKKVFSASCKDFDIIAPVKSEQYTQQIRDIKKSFLCVTRMSADDIYFFTLNYKGEKTVVYFQPTEKMLNNFKAFIPRKVYL